MDGMKPTLSAGARTLIVVLCGALVAAGLRLESPGDIAHAESSLSLYAAGRLLQGGLPYADVWYDRLPGTIIVNALAQLVGPTFIASTAMELLWLAGAGAAVFFILRGMGAASAGAGTAALWFFMASAALTCFGAPNSPHSWAALFSALFFLSVARRYARDGAGAAFASGLAAGAAACFIGREAVLVVVGLIAVRGRAGAFIAGFAVPPAALAIALVASGVAAPFAQALGSNLHVIAAAGALPRLDFCFLCAVKIAALASPLAMLFLSGAARAGNKPGPAPLRQSLAAWLFFEMVAIPVSGFLTPSSFISLLLPATVMLGAGSLFDESRMSSPPIRRRAALALFMISFMAVAFHAVVPAHSHDNSEWARPGGDPMEWFHKKFVAELVARNAAPDERVLVWSDSALVYALSGRAAPTRHATIKPLFIKGYADERIREFIYEVAENPPKLIVVEAPLLSEGMEAAFKGKPQYEVAAAQKPLFAFIQKLVRDDYDLITAHDGILICARKDDGAPGKKAKP